MTGGYYMSLLRNDKVKESLKTIIDSYSLSKSKQNAAVKKVKRDPEFNRLLDKYIEDINIITEPKIYRKSAINVALNYLITDYAKDEISKFNDDLKIVEAYSLLIDSLFDYLSIKLAMPNTSVKFTPGAILVDTSVSIYNMMCRITSMTYEVIDNQVTDTDDILTYINDYTYKIIAEHCVTMATSPYDLLFILKYLYHNINNDYDFSKFSDFFNKNKVNNSAFVSVILSLIDTIKWINYTTLFDYIYEMYNEDPDYFEAHSIMIEKKSNGNYIIYHEYDNIKDKSKIIQMEKHNIIGDKATILYTESKFLDYIYRWFYDRVAP